MKVYVGSGVGTKMKINGALEKHRMHVLASATNPRLRAILNELRYNMTPRLYLAIVYLSLLGLASTHAQVPARTMAWIVNENGHAAKLDLTRFAIVDTVFVNAPLHVDDLAADPIRGLVFAPHGRSSIAVDVYDLKTLRRKATLDFVVRPADGDPIRFILPPTGATVFARVSQASASDALNIDELISIDVTTFTTVGRRSVNPILASRLMLSDNGTHLYSLHSRKPARVDVFTVPSFSLSDSLDLEQYINPQAFGRSIHDFGRGKILINENDKLRREDVSSYTVFTFTVGNRTVTPKIHTGRQGFGTLAGHDRVVFEDQYTRLDVGAPIRRRAGSGILHVFNMLNATLLGSITISGVQEGEVLATSADGDYLYYQSVDGSENVRLSIVNLRTFSLIAQIQIS